jgi:hypothetical protein
MRAGRIGARALMLARADLAQLRDDLMARSPGGTERVRVHLVETINGVPISLFSAGRPMSQAFASWCSHAIGIWSSRA